ncbi:hypothetical protein FRB90_006092 [Tulasnella sp. 427]|nr:hypothetical protein FRB90_006092 [Tulasnella sp. 427]
MSLTSPPITPVFDRRDTALTSGQNWPNAAEMHSPRMIEFCDLVSSDGLTFTVDAEPLRAISSVLEASLVRRRDEWGSPQPSWDDGAYYPIYLEEEGDVVELLFDLIREYFSWKVLNDVSLARRFVDATKKYDFDRRTVLSWFSFHVESTDRPWRTSQQALTLYVIAWRLGFIEWAKEVAWDIRELSALVHTQARCAWVTRNAGDLRALMVLMNLNVARDAATREFETVLRLNSYSCPRHKGAHVRVLDVDFRMLQKVGLDARSQRRAVPVMQALELEIRAKGENRRKCYACARARWVGVPSNRVLHGAARTILHELEEQHSKTFAELAEESLLD